MSEAKPEDRFDALERAHEERQRGAGELSRLLGLDKEEKRIEPVRDEQGRFVGSADAGERGIPLPLRKSPGQHMLDLLAGDAEPDEDTQR
ncbi:MAG: hypothetical protein M3N00_02270 [Actinomycetota bacterium]|nr:hypothetical protein [Actinomycetota bacterium]